MKYLLDTHLLLWIAANSSLLPHLLRSIIRNPENDLYFSAVSIWEVAVKHALRKPDFNVDPAILQEALLSNGYQPLPLFGEHALPLRTMPWLHKDPFDRILIAQAITEGMLLLTADDLVARYPGPIRKV